MKRKLFLTFFMGNYYLLGKWFLISLFLLCSNEREVRASTDWSAECSICDCTWDNGKKKADCSRRANSISDFHNMSEEIEIIFLSENNIYSLAEDEFKNIKLLNLKQIFLHKNVIAKIHVNAFRGLKNLDILDLSENRLENIDPVMFKPLINLKELRLSRNPIQFSAPFPSFSTLKRLDLSHCNLSTLPPGIFEKIPSVTHLQLTGNRFRQLAVEVLEPVYNLLDLSLSGNPWDCDCHIRKLFQWTHARTLASNTMCEGLEDGTIGKKWDRMTEADFFCKPIISLFQIHLGDELHQGPIINVKRGNDITIECHVEADPIPEITWLRGDKPLVTDEKFVIQSSGISSKTSNLTIKAISGADAAVFTCRGAHVSGTRENSVERSVDVSVLAVGAVGVGGSGSKKWLWILFGILGFLLLVALLVLLIFCCLRRRRYRRKTHDQSGDFRVGEKKEPIGDQVDSTMAPLIEKPPPAHVETIVPLMREPELESNYAEVRSMTPMPQNGYHPAIYGYTNAPGLTRTYLSNSQVHLPRELHYHPGGYATYDPRRAPNNPIELNFRQPPNQYGRLYSPFSGSVASFASEPPARVPQGLGYVTLPRRRRVPSWSPAYGGSYPRTHVPPSPTGSLPPVPNLRGRYGPQGPRFDTIGPRTTADGGSNLSLNQVGLTPQTPMKKSPGGYLTPSTPVTPSSARLPRTFTPLTPSSGRIPKSSGSLQNYKGIPGTHFSFDPIEENDGPVTPTINDRPLLFPNPQNNQNQVNGLGQEIPPQKIPPVPPAKPKRKSQNLDEQNIQDISTIQGTEV